jgi:hypothetical protein
MLKICRKEGGNAPVKGSGWRENIRGGKSQMRGPKRCLYQPWVNAVQGRTGRVPGQGKPAGTRGAGGSERREREKIITAMVQGVIGKRIVLHTLLGCEDFAGLYSGDDRSRPVPKQWELGGVPFQASLLSHSLHYECRHLTIVSKGSLRIPDGRETSVWMELSLERGCVPPGSRGMEDGMPLILNFAASPGSFAETAFSFDIDQDNYGLTSGCGFVTIISPNTNIF